MPQCDVAHTDRVVSEEVWLWRRLTGSPERAIRTDAKDLPIKNSRSAGNLEVCVSRGKAG